jgi:hypothetical protein
MIMYIGMIIVMIFGMQFFYSYKLISRIVFLECRLLKIIINCAAVQMEVNGIVELVVIKKCWMWNDAGIGKPNRLEKLEKHLIKPSKKGKSK